MSEKDEAGERLSAKATGFSLRIFMGISNANEFLACFGKRNMLCNFTINLTVLT